MTTDTIESLRAGIAALTAKVEALEKAGPWKPEYGEEYWVVLWDVMRFNWQETTCDYELWDTGNVYPTKEAAELARDRQILITKMRRAAEASEGNAFNCICLFERKFSVYDAALGITGTPMFKDYASAKAFIGENIDELNRLFGDGK